MPLIAPTATSRFAEARPTRARGPEAYSPEAFSPEAYSSGTRHTTRPPRYGHRAAGRRPISTSTYDRPFTVFLGRVPGWKIALIVAAALAAVAALVVVAGTLFLLILPVILVAGLAHRLFGARRRGARGSPAGRDVIEGVFVSVSDERREIRPGKGEGRRRE